MESIKTVTEGHFGGVSKDGGFLKTQKWVANQTRPTTNLGVLACGAVSRVSEVVSSCTTIDYSQLGKDANLNVKVLQSIEKSTGDYKYCPDTSETFSPTVFASA